LESKFGVKPLQQFLKETGHHGGEHKALTEAEGRTILSAPTLDAARDRITAARQEGSGRVLSESLQGREAAGDPPGQVTSSPSTTPKDTKLYDVTSVLNPETWREVFGPIARDAKKALPKLEELGRLLYESGKRKFPEWVKAMGEYAGEAWKNFRSYAKWQGQQWEKAENW